MFILLASPRKCLIHIQTIWLEVQSIQECLYLYYIEQHSRKGGCGWWIPRFSDATEDRCVPSGRPREQNTGSHITLFFAPNLSTHSDYRTETWVCYAERRPSAICRRDDKCRHLNLAPLHFLDSLSRVALQYLATSATCLNTLQHCQGSFLL
jgi:hypothetical protein